MSARCPIHDLAVGPDGTCVLCRREHAPGSRSSWVWLGAGGVALSVLAVAAFALRRMTPAPIAEARPVVTQSIEIAEAEPPAPAPREREALPDRDPAPAPLTAFTVAPEVPPTAAAPRQDADSTELRAARRRVQVTLYTTSWCPHCDRARRWLQSSAVSFTEHDVERDESAKRAMRRLNPRGGVPTLDFDGRVLVGFEPTRAERTLDAAARARLRR